MTIKILATPDDEAQTPSPQEIRFLQLVCANLEREIEALKSRAAAGEVIDLEDLNDHEELLSRFVAGLEQLSQGTFDAHVPALRTARRGH